MKLRSGKITDATLVTPVAPKKLMPGELMEIDYTTVGLWENGKKFAIRRGGERDWHLTVYKDKRMMLILHMPYTAVDRFDNKPAKITYDDENLSIMIKRPIISYRFKFEHESEYMAFKNLKME